MCDHERLRTTGDRVFCCVCGKELPLDFLMNQGKPDEPQVDPEAEKPDKNDFPLTVAALNGEAINREQAEQEPEPAEQAADGKIPAENQADGKKPGKSPGRKSKAKNAD